MLNAGNISGILRENQLKELGASLPSNILLIPYSRHFLPRSFDGPAFRYPLFRGDEFLVQPGNWYGFLIPNPICLSLQILNFLWVSIQLQATCAFPPRGFLSCKNVHFVHYYYYYNYDYYCLTSLPSCPHHHMSCCSVTVMMSSLLNDM